MADTEETLRSLRQRISTVQSTRARAQVEHDNAKERMTQARARLKEEFGVETGEDAKRVRADLDKELARAISDVERLLAEAGA